jgi:hypothetical protein
MDPITMAAVGTAVGGTMSFKGKQAEAKQVQQIAEYNARVAENEKVALAEVKQEKKLDYAHNQIVLLVRKEQ